VRDRVGLRAEEPLGSGIRYVQNERKRLRGVTDELEARVDWAIFCAWGCKGGLREGVVFALEGESDSVTGYSAHIGRVECQPLICANGDGDVGRMG